MQRSVVRVFLLFAMLSLLASQLSVSALADESTPVASPEKQGSPNAPAVGATIVSQAESCDPSAFPAGLSGITYQPLENFGFVIPAESPDHNLYLTENTLQPGACILFDRGTFGASTLLVQEGTIEFIAWSGPPLGDPVICAGNEAGDYVSVPSGVPVTLDSGDWVTVDRAAAAYAYRNPGVEDGRIVMAIYELTGPRNGCHSGCRRNP